MSKNCNCKSCQQSMVRGLAQALNVDPKRIHIVEIDSCGQSCEEELPKEKFECNCPACTAAREGSGSDLPSFEEFLEFMSGNKQMRTPINYTPSKIAEGITELRSFPSEDSYISAQMHGVKKNTRKIAKELKKIRYLLEDFLDDNDDEDVVFEEKDHQEQ